VPTAELFRPRGIWLAGAAAFVVLAVANAAGYRFGAGDQAFYIPAITHHLNPALFPRDMALLGPQARFTVSDEMIAAAVRVSGLSLPALFFAGHLLSLVLLYSALVALGRRLYDSGWTTAALVVAYSFRHRIAKTGANTLESYFHPRMLAFALGALALHAVLERRAARAWLLIAIGALVHPTTALFFVPWVGIALAVNEPRLRRVLLVAAAAAVAAGAALLVRGSVSLAPMDQAWVASLADKDYVFPTDWSIATWAVNMIYPVVIAGVFLLRRRAGVARPGETGVVAGCLALVALFIVSWPLQMLQSTFVVQLQLSRMFWMTDLLATIYAVWLVAEAPFMRGAAGVSASRVSARRAQLVVIVLTAIAAVRGWYALDVQHTGRPFVQLGLADDEWTDAGRWIREHTPASAYLIADPGHAWRFGTSLRVSAERDVLVEDVKDVAIGMYDRAAALRTAERRAAIGDFSTMTAERLEALAARYDLDYVVSEQPMPLPEAYRNRRFHLYRLRSHLP
jgi:hypothetical protein